MSGGRLRVGIIFGGRSGEHEVSVMSARGILKALDPARFEPVPVGIDRQGRWQLVEPRALLEQDVPYSAVATVFPLGLLTLVLPISPSGLGVGHVAFKRLFEAIGLTGGATVFNVYLLGQITPCLLGVFSFLSLKRRGELPTELPPEPEADAPRSRG